jgi:hypothetical protein
MKGFFSKIPIFVSSLSKWVSFFLLAVILSAPTVGAIPLVEKFQKNSKQDLIHFKLKAIVAPEAIKLGEQFALYVKIELREGWHIYSLHAKEVEEPQMATKIFMNSGMFTPLGLWKEPTPVMAWDGALERVVKTHKQVVEFRRLYSATKSLATGSYPITGEIVFRACNNKICNLPKKISYRTKIDILVDKN